MTADTNERRPFLFEVDFGATENQTKDIPEVTEEPPPPTFSEEDLQVAKQDAYNTGYAAGNQESITGFEHRIAESLDVATTAFSRLAATQEAANKQIALNGLHLAAAVVGKMMPEMVRRHGAQEIEAAVTEILKNIIDEPTVTVTVHEDLTEPMAERLRVVAKKSGLEDRLLITGDPALGLSDCRIVWGEGGAERNADAIWSRLEETLDRNLAPTPEGSTPAPAIDSADGALKDAPPPSVELTSDVQTSETPTLPDAPLEPPTQAVIPSADVLEPAFIDAAPGLETDPYDINATDTNATDISGQNVEPGPQESAAPITVDPISAGPVDSGPVDREAPIPGAEFFEPQDTPAPELPDAVTPGLPGAVTPGLPGAVTPGLPGAVQPVEESSDPGSEPA